MRLPVIIQLNGNGSGSVYVGAVDIASVINGGKLMFGAGEVPRLELSLTGFPASDAAGDEAEVVVRPDHAELLVSLGWTPPPDGGS